MLEQSYEDLLRLGYTRKFLNEISTKTTIESSLNGNSHNNYKMYDWIRHIELKKIGSITKCIAILDEGQFYQIVEHTTDKDKSYDIVKNSISKSTLEVLADFL